MNQVAEHRAEPVVGPRSVPLPSAVETFAFWRDPHAYLRWCRQRYGSTFTMTPLAKPPLVFMSEADDIRAIVTAPADVLLPGQGGAVIAPLVGRDSFMLADGDDHLAGRRRILPGFQRQRVSAHTDMVSATVAAEIATWPLDEPVALGGRLRALTLRVILHTIFGVGDERVDQLHRRLLAMFQVAGTLTLHMPVLRHAPPWRHIWRRFLADRESVELESCGADCRARPQPRARRRTARNAHRPQACRGRRRGGQRSTRHDHVAHPRRTRDDGLGAGLVDPTARVPPGRERAIGRGAG